MLSNSLLMNTQHTNVNSFVHSTALIQTIRPVEKGATAQSGVKNERFTPKAPSPAMYLFIFGVWLAAIVWFQPRLFQLLDMAYNWPSRIALITFIFFIDFAWLYGVYNLTVIGFAAYYRFFSKKGTEQLAAIPLLSHPPIAILYTTCNDFVEASVLSCVQQDYPNYQVYILDDSSDAVCKMQVDQFAAQYPGLVQVVRRPDRKAFKAGNMNHGLANVAVSEPYFAIADAD